MNASGASVFARGTPEGAAAPGTVRARVLAARRAVAAVRVTESLFLATAAGLVTSAAALLSGAAPGHPHALGAALLAAAACGLTWWLETRPDAHAIARRIDRRLALRGALTTAFEVEAGTPRGGRPAGAQGALASLLCARVSARVTRRNALAAVLPSSTGVLALPFVAAALLAIARRVAEPSLPAVDVAALVAGLAERASALGRTVGEELAAGQLTPEQARLLTELVSRARGLSVDSARTDGEEERIEQLDRLRRDLDVAANAAPHGSESARRAGEAGLWAEAARDAALAAAEPPGNAADGAPPDVGPSAPPTDPGGPGPAGGMAGSGVGANEPLTGGEGRGTMSGSQDGGGHPPDASGSDAAPESGVVAGRTWSSHHDALVARWVEARRAVAAQDETPAPEPPEDR